MEIQPWNLLILFSIFLSGVRCQVTVEQNPLELSATEGQNSSITCQYKTTNFYSLHWYRQHPGERPTFLLLLAGKQASKEPNFSAEHDPKKKMSNLHIRGVQLQDAATYFCAVEAGRCKEIHYLEVGLRLVVNPNLQKSEPSVYELESTNKSHPLSACLFTDYFPGNINVSATGSDLVGIESSVVVVEDQASYGAVLWQNANENLQCIANYDGEDIQAKKDIADSCSGTQMSFQTDERLNLLSLTVLGLRVIFFKSVAVNLLLTFRLWSR
nr:TRAV7.2 [Sphenodon punctatus]